VKVKELIVLLLVGFVTSCASSSQSENVEEKPVVANSRCVLSIEGMMCEKGCKTTIEQRLSKAEGVVACKVDYENKKAELDFDNSVITSSELIEIVNEIADGIYSATLLEESVYTPTSGAESINSGSQIDEVSVSDYYYELPGFSNFFSNLI